MQVPNNNPSFIAVTPGPTDPGQTFHKQNFETDGVTRLLNVNNDPTGTWSGSNGGFNFATINSTLSNVLPLLELSSNGALIDTKITNTSGDTNLDLTNNALTLVNGTTTGFFNGYYFRITDDSQTYNVQSQITPANIVLTDQNNDSYLNASPNQILLAGFTDPKSNRIGNSGFTIDSTSSQTQVNFYRVLLTDTSESNTSTTKIQPASGFLQYKTLSAVGKINSNINFFNVNNAPRIVIDDNTSTTTITKNNITLNDGTNNSLLTTTGLTFNGVSYAQNQVVPTLIYSSPAIYADGQAPATSLGIRNNYGYSGWYFKNVVSGYKINWYFPAFKNAKVMDLKGFALSFFNANNTSNDNCPFVTVYTVPQPGDSTFYHSKNTYVFNQSITPTANTAYEGVLQLNGNLNIPYGYETQVVYSQSTVNNPIGPYLPTETILAVVIGSNSISPVNTTEFVVNKFNIIFSGFTQSFLLIAP